MKEYKKLLQVDIKIWDKMGQTGDRILSSHITNAHCYQERAKHGQSVPTLFVNAPFFGIFCINALPLSHSCVHYILGKLRLLCFLSFDANIPI